MEDQIYGSKIDKHTKDEFFNQLKDVENVDVFLRMMLNNEMVTHFNSHVERQENIKGRYAVWNWLQSGIIEARKDKLAK